METYSQYLFTMKWKAPRKEDCGDVHIFRQRKYYFYNKITLICVVVFIFKPSMLCRQFIVGQITETLRNVYYCCIASF